MYWVVSGKLGVPTPGKSHNRKSGYSGRAYAVATIVVSPTPTGAARGSLFARQRSAFIKLDLPTPEFPDIPRFTPIGNQCGRGHSCASSAVGACGGGLLVKAAMMAGTAAAIALTITPTTAPIEAMATDAFHWTGWENTVAEARRVYTFTPLLNETGRICLKTAHVAATKPGALMMRVPFR